MEGASAGPVYWMVWGEAGTLLVYGTLRITRVSPRAEAVPKRTDELMPTPVSERSRIIASLMKRAFRSMPSRCRLPDMPRQVEATSPVAAASTTSPTVMAMRSSISVKPARPADGCARMAITGR